MIKRSKVRYLDSVIMFAEENGFVENKAFMYKKSLDINNEKTVRINFETTYLTIAFKSRNLSIYFEPIIAHSIREEFILNKSRK